MGVSEVSCIALESSRLLGVLKLTARPRFDIVQAAGLEGHKESVEVRARHERSKRKDSPEAESVSVAGQGDGDLDVSSSEAELVP